MRKQTYKKNNYRHYTKELKEAGAILLLLSSCFAIHGILKMAGSVGIQPTPSGLESDVLA